MVLNWGEKRNGEGAINYPAIIYNQVLSQTQTDPFSFDPHYAAIADIVPHECPKSTALRQPANMNGHPEDDYDARGKNHGLLYSCHRKCVFSKDRFLLRFTEHQKRRETICCGDAPPSFCAMPEFLHLQMREYYPTINFYLSEEDWTGAQIVKKLNV